MKTDYLPFADGRLRYRDSEAAGPTLLCCHGNSSSADAFAQQIAALGERYRVIAVDLPGHGGSSPAREPAQAYTFAGFAAAVAAVATQLALSDYFIVGHSLGGHAALEALPRLDGLRGLVLSAAPPFNRDTISKMFLPDPSDGLVFRGTLNAEEVARLAAAFVNVERLAAAPLAQVEASIRAADPQVREQLGRSLGQGGFADECALLRESGVPALLVQGRADGFIDWRSCTERAHFPDCDLRVELLEDCGHNPHVEQPERFNDRVESFIEQTVSTLP